MNSPSRRALLLVDFQRDFLEDTGKLPVDRAQIGPVIAAARLAIFDAEEAGWLVLRVGNEFRAWNVIMNALRHGAAVSGSAGAAWDPRVGPASAPYYAKWRASAFCNPALGQMLDAAGVERITIAGLYARACVSATARAALERGLAVDLLRPAIACRSDGTRDRALDGLEGRGARVLTELDSQSHAPEAAGDPRSRVAPPLEARR